jgi:O-antigen/teichoic acid export membrane protein
MTSSTDTSSVNKLAIRGAIWTIAGYGASQVLRFGSNLILTRLLVPELFGLMALVFVFVTGLHLFSDLGLGLSIVQNKRGDERAFLNTAWTIQIMRGGILWVACLFLAYPVSQIYNEPRLIWLVPVVGLTTVISGFNSTAIYTLNRHLDIKKIALFEFSGQLLGTIVMIIWAWIYPTIWALVAGSLVTSLYQLFLSHRWAKNAPNRLTWDKTAARELFSFGIWIFLTTAMTFFGEQADRLILGKLLGFTMLGIYGIAMTFADLPRSVTVALSGKVIMPAIAKIADLPRSTIREKISRKRRPVLILMAVGIAGMATFGDFIIKVLYDERYQAAAWMLPILALGIWPRLLCNTNEPALFSLGRPQYSAAANVARFLFTALGIWIGYSSLGLQGAVIGVALNDLCYYLVANYGLWREGLSDIRQDILATGILICALIILLSGRSALGLGLPIDDMF